MSTSGFDQFYAKYFRRDARKDAEKAWRQVNGDAHLTEILAALEWQVPMYMARERHHRPMPATYLRGERWTDEKPITEGEQREMESFLAWKAANAENPDVKTVSFDMFQRYQRGIRRAG